MLVRTLDQVIGTDHDVDWGNGTSRRFLVAADGRGFAMTETYVRPGTTSRIRFDHHFEACYCIEGSGQVETESGSWPIEPGTVYAPDHHEVHTLTSREGMRLVCVFNPPLQGHENHDPTGTEPSGY